MLDGTELNPEIRTMTHHEIDQVSLEIARRVAARLRSDPQLLQLARDNLARWLNRNGSVPALRRSYEEWQGILERPLDEICARLTAPTDDGQRLRQNSPFAGVLAPAEIWEIKRHFRHHATTAA